MKTTSPSFQNIVVGVDLSPYSKVLFRQAQRLARQFKAEVTLVHAAFFPVNLSSRGALLAEHELNMQGLKKYISRYYGLNPRAKIHLVIEEGEPTDVILKAAKKLPNPLILIGSRGRNLLSRLVMGSEAENIARRSPYPVWVHRGKKTVPLKKIVVPTDFSAKSQDLMERLKKWNLGKNLSLRYLFVQPMQLPIVSYPQYQEALDRIRTDFTKTLQQFRRQRPRIPLITAQGEVAEKISRIGKRFDVIAMNPQSHLISKVMRLSEHPILMLRPLHASRRAS